MSKTIKYIVGGILILVLAAFTILAFTLNGLVKSGIERTGTELTQTEVTVEQVSINPWTGSGSIEGLKVRNPDDFESEDAIVIQNFEISLDITSIWSDTLILDEILISEASISVIQKVPQNNLRMLLRNMEEAVSGGREEEAQAMLIRRLLVRNARVSVTPTIGEQPTATASMEEFELQDVGRDGSATARQVVRKVADRIISEALQTALSGQLDELKDKARDAVKDIFN